VRHSRIVSQHTTRKIDAADKQQETKLALVAPITARTTLFFRKKISLNITLNSRIDDLWFVVLPTWTPVALQNSSDQIGQHVKKIK
jgi:hypothetical protein